MSWTAFLGMTGALIVAITVGSFASEANDLQALKKQLPVLLSRCKRSLISRWLRIVLRRILGPTSLPQLKLLTAEQFLKDFGQLDGV
jgi:hypothetical protein